MWSAVASRDQMLDLVGAATECYSWPVTSAVVADEVVMLAWSADASGSINQSINQSICESLWTLAARREDCERGMREVGSAAALWHGELGIRGVWQYGGRSNEIEKLVLQGSG
jgi:hypothetical protein